MELPTLPAGTVLLLECRQAAGGELIADLMSKAKDPALLATRELGRARTTWAQLGRERGVTGEAARRRVGQDAQLIRGLLASDRFRAVRWATSRLQNDLGLLAPADGDIVEQWRSRLGEHRFQALRWLAHYLYDGAWLLHGAATTQTTVARTLNDAAGDQWLIRTEDLMSALDGFANPESVARFLSETGAWRDIGDGWLIRWDGPLHAKAERVLHLVGKPMTPAEMIEKIGSGSEGSIKNNQGTSLVRIDKQFRLALPEWGYEEYEGITTEIIQRIERGGGIASRAAMLDEFTRSFGVSVSSIVAYLKLPIFDVDDDAVRLADAPGFIPRPPSTTNDAIHVPEGWGERHQVTERTMKGYSFHIDPHIAWANGIRPNDDLLVAVNNSPSYAASVIWRGTNLSGKVDVGRLRQWLADHEVGPGAKILVCPTPDGVTVHVGADAIDAARREFEAAAPPISPKIAALMEQL